MKIALPAAVKYDDYRDYLADLLTSNDLSIRAFVELVPEVTSRAAIANLLQKDMRGRYRGTYCLSTSTWVRLLKALKVREPDISYLVLVQLENDAEVVAGPQGGAYQQIMRKLRVEHLETAASSGESRLSSQALLIARVFDALGALYQKKVLKDVLKTFELFLNRQESNQLLASARRLHHSLRRSLAE